MHVNLRVRRGLVSAIDQLKISIGVLVLVSIQSILCSFCAEPGLKILEISRGQVLLGPVGTYLGASIRPTIDGLCGVLA